MVDRQAIPAVETVLPSGTRSHQTIVDIWSGPLQVRLAKTTADIDAAQALRYRIFYERLGAQPLPEMVSRPPDVDPFDDDCAPLLVLDHSLGTSRVVGTYRLIRRNTAARLG